MLAFLTTCEKNILENKKGLRLLLLEMSELYNETAGTELHKCGHLNKM